MNDHPESALSDDVLERRDALLDQLCGEMQQLHRRRLARRSALAVTTSVTIVVSVAVLALPRVMTSKLHDTVQVHHENTPAAIIRIVETKPSILARYAAEPSFRTERIDDQALLDQLAAMGQPSGLVRTGGRAWLTSSPTTASGPNRAQPEDSSL
jgi:hypothetical protein